MVGTHSPFIHKHIAAWHQSRLIACQCHTVRTNNRVKKASEHAEKAKAAWYQDRLQSSHSISFVKCVFPHISVLGACFCSASTRFPPLPSSPPSHLRQQLILNLTPHISHISYTSHTHTSHLGSGAASTGSSWAQGVRARVAAGWRGVLPLGFVIKMRSARALVTVLLLRFAIQVLSAGALETALLLRFAGPVCVGDGAAIVICSQGVVSLHVISCTVPSI